MSNKIFANLRKRMTLQYSLIFGVIILLIVVATYALTWWSLLAIEKQELHDKVVHEGEEWVESRELPVNEKELTSGDYLAYFVAMDGKTVILNQMGNGDAGKALMHKRNEWPSITGKITRMLRVRGEKNEHFRYLAAVCVVKDKGENAGYLYMFENMEIYYQAAFRTLRTLGLLFVGLFGIAIVGSYWLAGRNLKPISDAYDKQKQFTADASHEMRTPLAVMKLGVQGIEADEESKLSSFTTDTLTMLEQEVDRLSRLTENLMTLARSDNDKLNTQFTNVLLSDLCIQVANQLQMVASEKDIAIQRYVDTGININADENSLHRLLVILLDNAIKYSPESTDVLVQLMALKHVVQIKIADNGIGIKGEDKKKIFDRFYRVDKARSRSMGGLGLGLSLAKAIVEQHHGKIWVEDNKPHGSVFVVELPLK